MSKTAQMRTVDGQRAVDGADAPISQYVGAGDAEVDAFADAVTGAIEAQVPTTFASMVVDMGKSLIQIREERDALDVKLASDLRLIDEEADRQRAEVRLVHRMAATELGVRLQGVAKAMGA